MRIGISTAAADPGLKGHHMDGIGVYTKILLAQYYKLNQQVVPVVYSTKGNPQIPNSLIFPHSYPVSALAAMVPLGYKLNHQIEKQISIYHATDYLVPRFKKVPVAVTLHDAFMFKHPEWCRQSLRSIKNWLLRSGIKWAERFITPSAAAIPELVEFWGVKENKIDVIHHGVDKFWLETISDAEKNRVINKYNLSPDFLLSVGTLQPRKNFERIIEAFKQLPTELQKAHKLVIVGKNGYQSDKTLQEIKKLQDKNIGVWLEYISAEELRALYQSAKLFLFPSLYEGFGLPILEAFASKVPVITANITSMPEITADAAYLVDPYEIEQLKYAIQHLLLNEDICRTYIAKGSVRIKDFSWETCAEKTLAVYRKVIF